MRKFIWCIVSSDNSYDYELDGCWTDNPLVVDAWFDSGVRCVAALDAFSFELVTSYNYIEWIESRESEV